MSEAPASSTPPGAAMDRRIARRAGRRWRLPAGAAAGVGLLFAAWHVLPAKGSTDMAAADVETGLVTRAPFDDVLPVRATVAPAITTYVSAVSGGQVARLLVADGSMVAAGQPLATLLNPSLKLDILTREAAIASQLGTVSADDLALEKGRLDRATQTAAAGYDLVKARRDLSVQQQLHEQGFVSDAGVATYSEQARYQADRLSQLKAGQASEQRIAALQAGRLRDTRTRLVGTLAAVEQSLDALTLRAPVAGRLTNFTVQPGQNLKPGDPAGQIDSEGRWKLVADVDEYYLGRVRVGQSATGEGNLRLTVIKVLPAVTDGRFRIELGFAGAAPPLSRGQAIDVRVVLGASRSAVIAPTGAWLDSGGGVSAFVLDGAGRHAARRAIRVGARNPRAVEILAGLHPGDRIVTSATDTIKGDALNIR
ncbi:efflux RND transporter periplasmic adaptor subunit [Sphingomonas morindae]|uniref:HlyD family efflux transporter periplasmic adaptor subunit n=1 Tax=Sphingomonas morindae TaxID=1541170 RepID=A0ABY4XDN5_9SPHN|nr:HlyD family efflux transporter periplasmic adaptor subunit [Sphingomonas morindae]USI75045.1 HlyD family efflux transporter periplasmic adaptor subunit [Sphingomonas morindae]